MKKHRDIKLVTRERRGNYFVSEPNYDTTKFLTENLSSMIFGMIMKNKNMVKKENYVTWRQFHFIYKTNDIYKDIAEDVETRFNTSN